MKKLTTRRRAQGTAATDHGRRHAPTNKKKSTYLAYFGSLILIGTYVTKEEFHESWKEKSSSIDSVLSTYSIRRENRELLEQIDRTGDHVSTILGVVTKSGDAYRTWGSGLNDLSFEKSMIQYMQADMKNLCVVADELPNSNKNKEYLMQVEKEIAEQVHMSEKIEGGSTEHSVGSLAKGDEAVASELSDAAESITADAEVFRKKTKVKERIADIASFCLYVLGACLTLFGKVAGRDVEGVEEG